MTRDQWRHVSVHLWMGLLTLTVAAAACSTPRDVHQTAEASSQPCVNCHLSAYAATKSPPHTELGRDCRACHVTERWVPSTFVHSWTLENRHATLPCASCHTGDPPHYRGIPTVCSGCHQRDYDAVTKPMHIGLPLMCTNCHSTAGWKPSTFSHPWPLDGAHVKVECTGCHGGTPPRYAATPTTCDGCHHAQYEASTYPGHTTFPTTCGDCHKTQAFRPALAPGHPEASFPVKTGKHATSGVTCLGCHRVDNGPSTRGQNTDCIHCHVGAHERPAIDGVKGHVDNPLYVKDDPRVNACLDCHPKGQL